ncbi:hypothetical protein ABY45_16370 [Microbacterium maritypicum]|uniref:hypothetical protein n=1 Tax=Microbacterium maritypicum TaxID=33918 RepID=UPI003D6F6969
MHTSTAYRFTTAGSLEANPTLMRQRVSVAPFGSTFLTRREGAMLAHCLVVPRTSSASPQPTSSPHPPWLRMSAEDARSRVLSVRSREHVYRVVAALDQGRTMTVEQIEALTDISKFAAGARSLLSAMWNAGLVELCQLGPMFQPGPRQRDGFLVRPTKLGAVLHELEDQMSYPEWLSTTAGMPFDSDRQFARHNVLATELGLRMAEFGNVGTVLGEKLSSMSLLAYAGVGDQVPTTGASGGSDLTLVRSDGLRIAVEVAASVTGGWIYDKVERLVRVLHRRPLARTGLCVLFVVAPRRESVSQAPREVLRKVKQDIQKAVRAYPGRHGDLTANRIGVVSWADLFPDGTTAVADLRKLPIERPTGRATRTGRTCGSGRTSSTLSRCRSPRTTRE